MKGTVENNVVTVTLTMTRLELLHIEAALDFLNSTALDQRNDVIEEGDTPVADWLGGYCDEFDHAVLSKLWSDTLRVREKVT